VADERFNSSSSHRGAIFKIVHDANMADPSARKPDASHAKTTPPELPGRLTLPPMRRIDPGQL
jgi:hypothetical protein